MSTVDVHEISLGVERIAAERRRQIEVEGYGPAHDRGHADELARAAALYAMPPSHRLVRSMRAFAGGVVVRLHLDLPHFLWPWNWGYWKPGLVVDEDDLKWRTVAGDQPDATAYDTLRIRELEKAGALIAAAIDDHLADLERPPA